MRILAGWNGTSEGSDALRLAAGLTRRLSGRLVVACVIEPGLVPPELTRHRDEWVDRFSHLIKGAHEELGDLDFTVREAIAEPAEGLREIALEEGAELVVLGSTHRGVIGRVLPGSVAERLLADGEFAVAIAPKDYASASHFGLGIVGVGYDGSPAARGALEWAARVAHAEGDELKLLTVAPDYIAGDLPLGPLEPLREEPEHRLARALEQVPGDIQSSATVMTGDPAVALEEQGIELDLLVIGSRGRGPVKGRLLGSVSADVIRKAPCPVVVVPEPS
jgi:nucleotide-binding universal stress UspA family protein